MTDSPQMPSPPLTNLAAGAVQLHENFMAHVEAGFTREEALKIMLMMIAEAMRNNRENGS